jgi:hypothetical protein
MGNSIDKISDKFYISSVEPLGDKRRIDELGVTHILNGAEEHLYRNHGGRLEGITYKVMGWDDAVGQIILPQLREAADFVEQVGHQLRALFNVSACLAAPVLADVLTRASPAEASSCIVLPVFLAAHPAACHTSWSNGECR